MAQLTLNNIDERLLRSIELRAEAMGCTVEDVVREALERGLRTDARGRAAVAARIRAMTPGPIDDDSTDIIRRLRDGS
jgi:plasmid stability protein